MQIIWRLIPGLCRPPSLEGPSANMFPATNGLLPSNDRRLIEVQ